MNSDFNDMHEDAGVTAGQFAPIVVAAESIEIDPPKIAIYNANRYPKSFSSRSKKTCTLVDSLEKAGIPAYYKVSNRIPNPGTDIYPWLEEKRS